MIFPEDCSEAGTARVCETLHTKETVRETYNYFVIRNFGCHSAWCMGIRPNLRCILFYLISFFLMKIFV